MPDKLKEMQALFLSEAAKNQVFPLDNSVLPARLHAAAQRHRWSNDEFTYRAKCPASPSATRQASEPATTRSRPRSTVPEAARGMIATMGGRFGGYGLYMLKGKPVFVYNLLDLKRSAGRAASAQTTGWA